MTTLDKIESLKNLKFKIQKQLFKGKHNKGAESQINDINKQLSILYKSLKPVNNS